MSALVIQQYVPIVILEPDGNPTSGILINS